MQYAAAVSSSSKGYAGGCSIQVIVHTIESNLCERLSDSGDDLREGTTFPTVVAVLMEKFAIMLVHIVNFVDQLKN